MAQVPIHIIWSGNRPPGHVPPRTRIDVKLPLDLIPHVDPSVPPPPYLEANQITSLNRIVVPVWKRILSTMLYEMLGPDVPAEEMIRISGSKTLTQSWSGHVIPRGNYNTATGYWKDQYGEEGYGMQAWIWSENTVDSAGNRARSSAPMQTVDGYHLVVHYEIPDEDDEPNVIEVTAKSQLVEGKVILTARQVVDAREKREFNWPFMDGIMRGIIR